MRHLPIRLAAPLLALIFGLGATLLEYQLNLHLDLARNLEEVRDRAGADGRRLAFLTEKLLALNAVSALQVDLQAMARLPQVKYAAVVDAAHRIMADSTGEFAGQLASETPLAPAAALDSEGNQPQIRQEENTATVLGAHPIKIGPGQTGWVLLIYDRTKAVSAAKSNARTQLVWIASALAVISFGLWAGLHFGFAERLARLARSVKAFGEGINDSRSLPTGGDEVGSLSSAFKTMREQLQDQEKDRIRLEREVLEISDRERRRIGHDLHDGLGQKLTAASMCANALMRSLQTESPAHSAQCGEIGRQLREAIAETRSLSHGLAIIAFTEDGLTGALRQLAETTSHDAVKCVFECPEALKISNTELAEQLYRIAQEAVNNALKHAGPSEIRIGLEQHGRRLVLEVDDDGAGMEESKPALDGIGLRVMRYRASLISAELKIGAAPAGGTRISCSTEFPQ